jgi:hypothetical protein
LQRSDSGQQRSDSSQQRSDSSQQRKHDGDRHSPQPHVCRSSVGHEVQQQGF